MKHHTKIWQSLVAVIGLMVASALADAANSSKVIGPGQQFNGKSYNELANEWTNWLVVEPFATNPALDPDGSFCDSNQQGPVWFLASTLEDRVVDRTCNVPNGKSIFISLGGVFVSFSPDFPTAGDPCLPLATELEQVRCDVNDDVPLAPNTSFDVTIDGEPVQDLFAYRTQSPPGGFTLRVPDPSFITDSGLPAGDRSPAVADGYFLWLKPLTPGQHTLNLIMTSTNPKKPKGPPITRGVNYTLIVSP